LDEEGALEMIELPETHVLAEQIQQTLVGKTIQSAVANHHPHGFAWYFGDPAEYNEKLAGRTITGSAAYGGQPEIWAGETRVSFNDGVRARYLAAGEKRPEKHQLLLEFTDGTGLSCSVQMYGGMFAFENGSRDDWYYTVAKEKPSPYTAAFDEAYFGALLGGVKQKMSVKAFLATEQRIPGFGNGVLQDTLFNARLHPKRKLETLTGTDTETLFRSIKSTLAEMLDGGGRDTERDLFGKAGGYRTVLSGKTLMYPCPVCGSGLKREAYLGGNIYFCPACQPV
jgi:formamidopyrimidine-DNA glycosylase